ncbi:hypothetical protein RJ640_021062 [Escallonia rubra]|uniref:DYW domain-containing protein n=1 Tax=Escallonia rubra TaxID=112253 RepID=A0AA88UHR7_9ASTE|nr:hypothetical protein RJ640_021062 [Escallonia rubra]
MLLLRLTTTTCATSLSRAFSSGFACTSAESPNLLEKVRMLCTRGHLEEALSLFYTLHPPPSHQTYATLFHACARHGFLVQGQALHRHMLTHNPNTPPDLFVTNHLINMYAKCGYLDYAQQLFDGMPHRNIVSWTALISGYAQHSKHDECFGLFSGMVAHCPPTEFAYSSVLTGCDRDRGTQVHALAVKTSFDACVYVANALITMYSKSTNYDVDKDDAWRVFKDTEFRTLITWNAMIACFQLRGQWTKAIQFFSTMQRDGVGFDRATLLSVISSLCGGSGNDADSGLSWCLQFHGLTIKTGFVSEIKVASALIKAYSILGGAVSDCYNLFMETSGHRDLVSWTGIISTVAEREPEEALFLFCRLRQEGLAPDRFTFSIALKACAGLVTARHASAVHCQVILAGLEDDIVLANALIHAYARCGSIAGSEQVFDEMGFRNTVSWNSILKAYGLHGQAENAMQIFSQMDAQPDATTFIALLSACSHAGMVEEGTKIFDSMSEKYGLVPQLDHFACMVDMLGRAGRLLEAEKLISNMPMESDAVVWSALLGACRKHGETQLAHLAATKLKELDPENSLGYVLMSNIYCSVGSFNEAGLVRKDMKGLRVRKQPGLSWAEIGNRVHEFASGGIRHPQGDTIRANLQEIVKKLKVLGYVPETSLVLHDIEEEHKEEQLYYHSEKLAFVFSLMSVERVCGLMGDMHELPYTAGSLSFLSEAILANFLATSEKQKKKNYASPGVCEQTVMVLELLRLSKGAAAERTLLSEKEFEMHFDGFESEEITNQKSPLTKSKRVRRGRFGHGGGGESHYKSR